MSKATSKTGVVTAAGAMSGTSLDGVDVAVLRTDGRDIAGFGRSAYRAYTADERAVIAAGFGLWSGDAVEAAARVVDVAHLQILGDFADVDLIGFHGQTLAHAPRLQGTLQVGDGALLAERLGVPVVWDFRHGGCEPWRGGCAAGAVFSPCVCAVYWGGWTCGFPQSGWCGEPDVG